MFLCLVREKCLQASLHPRSLDPQLSLAPALSLSLSVPIHILRAARPKSKANLVTFSVDLNTEPWCCVRESMSFGIEQIEYLPICASIYILQNAASLVIKCKKY